jgi:hypothetical protein
MSKNWIQNAILKPNALRKATGTKKGHNISSSKLNKMAKGKGINAKRANLAKTLAGFKHQ